MTILLRLRTGLTKSNPNVLKPQVGTSWTFRATPAVSWKSETAIGLIEHSARSEKEYAASLERMISSENLWHQAGGTPETWANESFQLAKKVWLNNAGAVDDAYYRTNINIVSQRLALAGLRLAKLLNQIFAGQSS